VTRKGSFDYVVLLNNIPEMATHRKEEREY